jgi:hypothetical protein
MFTKAESNPESSIAEEENKGHLVRETHPEKDGGG